MKKLMKDIKHIINMSTGQELVMMGCLALFGLLAVGVVVYRLFQFILFHKL